MNSIPRVYVFKAADGTVKLGHSVHPHVRVKQVGKPCSIAYQSEPIDEAEVVERLAHKVLALHGNHIRGEWFQADVSEAIRSVKIAERQWQGVELRLGGKLKRFNPPAEMTSTLTVQMPQHLIDAISRCAKADKRNRSEWVRVMLEVWCEAIEAKKKS